MVDVASETLAVAMLLLAFGVVALGVAGRYVLVTPFPWTVEIGRFAFIWLCLSGLALTERRRAHFQITLLADKLSPAGRRVLAVVREVVVFVVLALFLVDSIKFGRIGANAFSSVLELPLQYIYVALPISVALTAINRMRCVAEDWLDPDGAAARLKNDLAQGEATGGST